MSDEKLLQLSDISNYKYCGSVLFGVYSASELQRLIDQRDRLLAEQDQRIAELEPQTKYPPAALAWLFSHCRAIGMTNKSDSGKWEEDIALFTVDQKQRIAELEAELVEAKRVTFDQAVLERMNALEAELDRERHRLAACGVAAFGYFDGCHDDYKSASLDDVLRLRAERDAARKDHLELLYAVARKFPGESRHQTALRYITEAEERSLTGDAAIAAKEKP
jgi:hypothetical protein